MEKNNMNPTDQQLVSLLRDIREHLELSWQIPYDAPVMDALFHVQDSLNRRGDVQRVEDMLQKIRLHKLRQAASRN